MQLSSTSSHLFPLQVLPIYTSRNSYHGLIRRRAKTSGTSAAVDLAIPGTGSLAFWHVSKDPGETGSCKLTSLLLYRTIHRILVNGDGKTHDIVIGPNDTQEHKTTPFLHTLIGRYSNRIPVGESRVEKDGVTSQLSIASTGEDRVHAQLISIDDGLHNRKPGSVSSWWGRRI